MHATVNNITMNMDTANVAEIASALALGIIVTGLIAAVVAGGLRCPPGPSVCSMKSSLVAPPPTLPVARWSIIGTGIAAGVTAWYMPPLLRAACRFREASSRLGGRVLSTPKTIVPMSTATPALDFGAWVFGMFAHAHTATLLQAMQIPVVFQTSVPTESFVFVQGRRLPWPAPPSQPTLGAALPYSAVPTSDTLAWFAHTGLTQAVAGAARQDAVWGLIPPASCVTVAGPGWESVPVRAVGTLPVQYNRQLTKVQCDSKSGYVNLAYASGETETVQGVVITGSPAQLGSIQGILPVVASLVSSAFVHISQGVLLAQWPVSTTWWPSHGFRSGKVATDTRLGTIAIAGPGILRFQVSGSTAVNYWTDVMTRQGGMATAVSLIAKELAVVFGLVETPPPAFVSYRGWPQGLWLWSSSPVVDDPTRVANILQRPCGDTVPVWYASSDISVSNQGWVEGAIETATTVAVSAGKYLSLAQ